MTAELASGHVSTTNACKLCMPLGACLVFRGIERGMPLLHGSQGCSTYIRRYLISHFGEPVDVASSSFNETTAIFGGGSNLEAALRNVTAKYRPRLIGVATTCLAETIGDDVPLLIGSYLAQAGDAPRIVTVSTPSYQGTHAEGFHAAVKAVVEALAEGRPRGSHVNLLPGLVSPADMRYLREVLAHFGLPGILLPDYSESLDGVSASSYEPIPPGGTPVEELARMGGAQATIQLGSTLREEGSAGGILDERFGVPCHSLGLPIGIDQTDRFFHSLEVLSSQPTPAPHAKERGRLVDAYVDGHKYVFGKRAVVYGEEDLVVGLAGFLSEIGIVPVLCASGGKSGRLSEAVRAVADGRGEETAIGEDADFLDIAEEVDRLAPDLLIGSSKGYPIARRLGIPLVRVGFPIHDRFGGQRLLHLGYRGTQRLLDQIVNVLLEAKQGASPVGYSYM